jgi:hypothetical protein
MEFGRKRKRDISIERWRRMKHLQFQATVSGNEHGVSPEVGAIAADDSGDSDEGESESENEKMESGEENKCEEEIGEGEEGHE